MSENGLKDVVAALCMWATAVRDEDERAVSWDDFWPIVEYLESYESESAPSAADVWVKCPVANQCYAGMSGRCGHSTKHVRNSLSVTCLIPVPASSVCPTCETIDE